MEDELAFLRLSARGEDHCVAGIGTTLIAGNDVDAFTQVIDDLAFALVAPLGAHYDLNRHGLCNDGSGLFPISPRRTPLGQLAFVN